MKKHLFPHRAILRLAIYAAALLLSSIPAAFSQSIGVFGQDYPVREISVSKSSIVRLASIRDSSANMRPRNLYLPAGVILVQTDRSAFDEKGREWFLTVTENGVLVYTLAEQTFLPDVHLANKGGKIAVSQRKIAVNSAQYPNLTITPSEVYAFDYQQDGKLRLTIDQEKLGNAFASVEYAVVDIEDFGIVNQFRLDRVKNAVKNSGAISYFSKYDAVDEIFAIIDSLSDFDIDANDRQSIREFLERKYITNKECNDEIKIELNADAEISAKISQILSPIDAKLGISGKFTKATIFREGSEFEIQRYSKGEKLFEIKNETIRETCNDLTTKKRIEISESGGAAAEINTETAKLRDLEVTVEGLPKYSCRNEYLRLYDVLTQEFELSRDGALLALMQGSRYSGNNDASVCFKSESG